MDVLMVTAFVSLVLVAAGVVLYVSRARAGDFEHGDRLSLLPLEDDEGGPAPADAAASTDPEIHAQVHPTRGGSA